MLEEQARSSLLLLCPLASPSSLRTSAYVSVKWWWWVRRLGLPDQRFPPAGTAPALAVGTLLISHKTNQESLGGHCVQAPYKQETTREEGVPLLNHKLTAQPQEEQGW